MHKCPQRQCTCLELFELTELYRELKCQRKRASEKDETRECISTEELQMTKSQAEHILGIVRTQREGVSNLMTALCEFSQKLSKQEEILCQTDKEIADLREEMRRIKEQYKKKPIGGDKCQAVDADQVAWKQAFDLELQEQYRLQNKIKQLTECLQCHKIQECACISDNAKRQEDRKTDAKLLLNAMDYVDRCIQE